MANHRMAGGIASQPMVEVTASRHTGVVVNIKTQAFYVTATLQIVITALPVDVSHAPLSVLTAETATHLIIYFDDIPGSESSDCLLRFLWKTFSLLKFTYSFCQISSSTGKKPFGTSTTWHIFYIIS